MTQFSHSAGLLPIRPIPAAQSHAASSARSVQSILPTIGITKRRLKQLDAIQLIRDQREKGKQELAYNARPFILCGIPLRRPARDQLTYSRHSGKFFLRIIGHPDYGLPFGQDRLIPIWVATLALRQKSRTVMFETAAEMLEFFRLAPDGYHYHRLIQGFKRVFSATIFFGTEDHPDGRAMIDWARFHFFDQMKLWFDAKRPLCANPGRANGNVITLSESFYQEIDAHRIPVERHVVAALAHAPGVLDFYLWIVWKSWTIKGREVRVPLTGPGGLSMQLGTREYSRERRFRDKIFIWLEQVKAFWPACPAQVSNSRRFLVVRSSRCSPAIRPVENPAGT